MNEFRRSVQVRPAERKHVTEVVLAIPVGLAIFRAHVRHGCVAQTPSKAQVFLAGLITTGDSLDGDSCGLFLRKALVATAGLLLIMIFLADSGAADFTGLVERRNLVCSSGVVCSGCVVMVGTFCIF